MLSHTVTQCPFCKNKNVYFSKLGMKLQHSLTEAAQHAHCADCGFTYKIIYIPDRIEEIAS